MIALTAAELAEISDFARRYPETAPQMLACKDPRELLERVRNTLQELRANTPQVGRKRKLKRRREK